MRKKAVLTTVTVIVLVLFLGGLMLIRHLKKIPFSLDDSRIKKVEVSYLTEDGVKKKTLTGCVDIGKFASCRWLFVPDI